MQISVPDSSRCVAKPCRKTWQLAGLQSLASWTARFMARGRTDPTARRPNSFCIRELWKPRRIRRSDDVDMLSTEFTVSVR